MADWMLVDPLTGVGSRAAFQQALAHAFQRAPQTPPSIALALLDIDHYKSVNDAFGHARGDQVLAEAARRLAAHANHGAGVYRYGGDEFVLLIPGADPAQARTLIADLLHAVRAIPFSGQPEIHLTLSIGVAFYPQDGAHGESLLRKADERLLEAKHRGRDQAVYETLPTAAAQLRQPQRLIERDHVMHAFSTRLNALPDEKRLIFRLSGEPGAGFSRCLAEARSLARLRGYAVMAVVGAPSLRQRSQGAVGRALSAWKDLSLARMPGPQAALAMQKRLTHENYAGLLITLDQPYRLDAASCEFIRALFFEPGLENLALVYTDDGLAPGSHFPANAVIQETLALKPLSQQGVHIWLRHALGWEAPRDFSAWVHSHSRGGPRRVQALLSALLDAGALQNNPPGGWRLNGSLDSLAQRAPSGDWPLPPPNNIPADLPNFFDRLEESENLHTWLNASPMVTLVGLGGSGKTRLALQVAAEILEQHKPGFLLDSFSAYSPFPDGVFFVPLASTEDGLQALFRLAGVLRLTLNNRQPVHEQLLHALQTKRMLLALDNLEPLPELVAFLDALTRQAPGVHILATAHQPLRVQNERVLRLAGLEAPPESAEAPERSTGVQFFLETARRADPEFAPTPADLVSIGGLVRLLGGLPLAIELAASWTPRYSCAEIQAEIESQLAAGMTGDELQAVFASAWRQLAPAERSLVCRLAVFRSPFSVAAARRTAGVSSLLLDALVAKALLQVSKRGYYKLQEMTRRFMLHKLENDPPAARAARAAHATFYAQYLQTVQNRLRGPEEKTALQEIEFHIDDLRQGWDWAIDHRRSDLLAQSSAGLFQFYLTRGWFIEGGAALKRAAAAFSTAPALAPAEKKVYARVLVLQGEYGYLTGNLEMGVAQAQAGLALAQALDDRGCAAQAQNILANLMRSNGDYTAAEPLYHAALKLFEESGDNFACGEVLNNLGVNLYYQRRLGEAFERLTASLKLFKRFGNPGKISRALNNCAVMAFESGNFAAAEPLLLESLQLSEEIDAPALRSSILSSLSDLWLSQDKPAQAVGYLHAALLNARRHGLESRIALEVFVQLGELFACQGELDLSLRLLYFGYAHPATPESTRRRAERLLVAAGAQNEAHLPPLTSNEAYQAALQALEQIPAQIPAA